MFGTWMTDVLVARAYARGWGFLTKIHLELDILQKLSYKGSV